MKHHLLPIIASLALASATGGASAAEHNAMSRQTSMPTSNQSMAKDNLSLTAPQQKLAWDDIGKSGTIQTAPSGFKPTVGVEVPSTLTLRSIPGKAVGRLPELKLYDYALLKNELLIVNPTDKKIVEVINAQG